ncbi:MAG TPA: DUF2892 domain-containing protein [Gemmatimonadales bacterium]|jgi:EamA domain-containing membrane protein RarD
MPMHYAIRLIAGTFVLGSLALGYWVNPLWFLFTAFVGLNLIQSAFTRWCLMETILAKLGVVRAEREARGAVQP